MKVKTLAVALVAAFGFAIPASAGATTLVGSGSIAAQPVFVALFNKYEQIHKDIDFVYTANGGNVGVQDVQSGRSQFAGQARSPLPSDAGTTYIKMYLDGGCMFVHPSNQVSDMTIPLIADVYHANVTNWADVPGSNLTSTINPVGRDTNGGQYNFFLQTVLNNQPYASNVNALPSDGLVINAVKRDPSAIGNSGYAWKGPGVKTIKVNGVGCEYKSIQKMSYPLSRYIFVVLPTDNPNADVVKWINWARTSKAAGKIIKKAGGVPAFNKGFK
jgi:phosphate transport system substrate-binding protein